MAQYKLLKVTLAKESVEAGFPTAQTVRVVIPNRGPAGPRGADGERGADGAPSTVPGPQGEVGPQGPAGPQGEPSSVPGPQGEQGPQGERGEKGDDGDSAYEVAVANGFSGTEEQWLTSLVGEQGPPGEPGEGGGVTSYNDLDDIPSEFPPEAHAANHTINGTVDLTDSSGNDNTLTNNNGAPSSIGRVGAGIVLNGTSQYLTRSTAQTTDELSLSLWFKGPSSQESYAQFITFFSSGGSDLWGTYINFGDSNRCFYVYDGSTYGPSSTQVADSAWHHIVVTLASNGDLRVYIDGNLTPEISENIGAKTISFADIKIGYDGANGNTYLAGTLDAIGIWTSVISNSDITALYNSGNGSEALVDEENLFAFWGLGTGGGGSDPLELDASQIVSGVFDGARIPAPTFTNTLVIEDADNATTATFDAQGNLTDNRTYALPDQSGTIIVSEAEPDDGEVLVWDEEAQAWVAAAQSGGVTSYNDLDDLPTLGTASAKDAPASGNATSSQVVLGDDTRLTDARTPTSHSHTPSEVGLSNVTNNAQTQAAIVPNTAPSAGQILAGNSGGTAYAPVTMSGDATLASTGALTLANSGVSASTYKSVTVDAKGRVTSGTNPTTLSGYGITDAATSSQGTKADSALQPSLADAKGDLLVATANDTVARLAVSGNNGYVLTEASGETSGLKWAPKPCELIIACSDETTSLTTGTAKVTFRAPYAFLLTGVRASVNTAPTGSTLIVDINNGANSTLSTKLSIDASEKTSTTAASAAVIDTAYDDISDDAEISIDIDQIGSTVAGKGLKVTLIGTRA